jgi:hypothetical protein
VPGSAIISSTYERELLVKRDAQGASSNEVTMETSVGRLESLGQVDFEGDREI